MSRHGGILREPLTPYDPAPHRLALPPVTQKSGGLIAERATWRRAWRDAAILWAVTRVALAVATYFGVLLASNNAVAGPRHLLFAWNKWDAGWFISVAQFGYANSQQTAFFPLYPILIAGLHVVLPWTSYFVCAALISNGALLVALALLLRLVERELSTSASRTTALLLLAYPAAFYLTTAYSESIFLALVLGTFLSLRSGRWVTAGVLAGLATLTRPTGGMLAFAFAWEFLRQSPVTLAHLRARQLRLAAWRGHAGDFATLAWRLLATAAIPLALGGYCYFLWRRFGNPFTFAFAESKYWYHVSALPAQGLWLGIQAVLRASPWTYYGARGLLDIVPIVAFLCIAVTGIRTIPLSYSLFGFAVILLSLIAPIPGVAPLQSGFRYLLPAFSVLMVLAVWSERWPWLRSGLIYVWLPLQGILVILFLHSAWII